jgi:hypothetical protein
MVHEDLARRKSNGRREEIVQLTGLFNLRAKLSHYEGLANRR